MEQNDFIIKSNELRLNFSYPNGERRLAVDKNDYTGWLERAYPKLLELLCIDTDGKLYGKISEIRMLRRQGYMIKALKMDVGDTLQLPGYLLIPDHPDPDLPPVLGIQGHGSVLGVIGLKDDYHHKFGEELCLSGRIVLAPEIRGFGALKNLSTGLPLGRLDYGNWGNPLAFTLVTDAFQKGRTLIGDSVSDLLSWADYLLKETGYTEYDTAGISYGGDMALCLTAIDRKVRRAFISGSFGSFSPIFERCYNLPAHCIPGVLQWMDRVDIAAMCMPRPMCFHYGELDVPSMDNASASYNETVMPAYQELLHLYAAYGNEDALSMHVTTGSDHEMDIPVLKDFLNQNYKS